MVACTMRTGRPVVGAMVLCVALALAQDEPAVDGKTLSEWEHAVWTEKPPPHRGVTALGEMGEPAIPALIKLMREHPGGDIRFLSQIALAKIGQPAIEPMEQVLADSDRSARMAAVLGLEKALGEAAVPVLTPLLQDPSPGVVARAAGALLRITEDADAYLPPLVDALRSEGRSDRWVAAESLGWCGEKAAGAVPALIEALPAADDGVRKQIIVALTRIGTRDAREGLAMERTRELSSDGRWVRLQAAHELGADAEVALSALPALRDRLADRGEDVLVRGYCAWAIDQIDPAGRPAEPRTFHVSTGDPNASDEGPGSEAQPWKTIQRAAEAMHSGDTVIIGPGVYRECIRPFRGGESPEGMVTYRAAPSAEVIIKGSDIWTPDWERTEVGGLTAWAAPWQRLEWDHPEQWPKPNEGPMHRAEQVFADGKLLTHVATLDELARQDGAFCTDDDQGKLLLRLPDDAPPADHLIERSARQQIFAPAVRGLGYIRVQGLKLTHAANPESNGANWGVIGHRAALSTRAGHHWVIEDNEVTWANAQGVDVGGEGWSEDLQRQPRVSEELGYHQVRRNVVSYNGVAGIVGWGGGCNHLLLEDNVTNYNCLKGNFYAYEAAGVKLHNADHVILRRHRSHGNEAFGIWFDHKCHHNRITQCTVTDSRAAGIFVEVSRGPNLVDTNVVIGTRDAQRGGWADGLYSHDADETTWANNLVVGNGGWGARIRYLVGRKVGWGMTTAHRNRVVNNIIARNVRGAVNLQPETDRGEDTISDLNILGGAAGPPGFFLDGAGLNVKWEETDFGRKLGLAGSDSLTLDLAQWREVGHDRRSLVRDAAELFAQLDEPIPPDEHARELLDALRRLWDQRFGLDDGYGEYEPLTADQMLTRLEAQ